MPLIEMRTVEAWSTVSENRLTLLRLLSSSAHFFVLFLVYHVKEDGWVKVSQTDVKGLYYKYQEEKDEL